MSLQIQPQQQQQQQQPQPVQQVYPTSVTNQQPSHHSNGSFGTVFIVLAIILVISVIACFLGRLCNRRYNKNNNYNHNPNQKPNIKQQNHQNHNHHGNNIHPRDEGDIEFGLDRRIPRPIINGRIGAPGRGPHHQPSPNDDNVNMKGLQMRVGEDGELRAGA